jgi:hypothetical protein
LRANIINNEPELRGRARADCYPFERVLAEAVGKNLSQSANNLIPRRAVLSAVAGLRELYESHEAQALAAPPSAAELLKLVDRWFASPRPASMVSVTVELVASPSFATWEEQSRMPGEVVVAQCSPASRMTLMTGPVS